MVFLKFLTLAQSFSGIEQLELPVCFQIVMGTTVADVLAADVGLEFPLMS